MKNKYLTFLLSAVFLSSAMTTPVRASAVESCATDSFYLTIHDWDKADEASETLEWNIRTRLKMMMIAPGWENVHTVVAAAADRPFLMREYDAGKYNAKVSYRYCWEFKEEK